MDSTETILQLAKDNATSLIKGGLKNSYVIVRENEILIMDTKDINTATNVWRWNAGGLGHSSTGYYGTYGTAITQDGQIVADFITTGVLNANLIKTGLLQSLNGVTTINMETGKFSNIVDGYGTVLERGGLLFSTEGENVGGIRSTRFADDKAINGFNIVNTKNGDYIDIGYVEGNDFEVSQSFTPVFRISKVLNSLLGNFIGIQLLEDTRLKSNKTLFFESNDSNTPHEIYNSTAGYLCEYGDNGIILGYKSGTERIRVFQIREEVGDSGSQIYLYKQCNMQDNKMLQVADIFTGTTTGRYLHEGWVGSIEKTAKRISNLNVYYDSGWYAYSTGSQGAPSDYGVMLHLKWGESDFIQIAFDFANNMYQRAWVNGGWTNWKTR